MLILLILLILLYIVCFYKTRSDLCTITQINSAYSNSESNLSDPYYDLLSSKYKYVDNVKDADIVLFSDYTLIDQNIYKLDYKFGKQYYIFGINGTDFMANKALLSIYVKDKWIPRTYILNNYNNKQNGLFILKKNLQRQEGTFISNGIPNDAYQNGYVVAQELLQNPLIVNGRKINMRIYMFITVVNNDVSMYIYNNGFIYYSPKLWVKNSIDKDVNITTGYIDRKIYEKNPLTHKDLYEYLGYANTEKLKKQINMMFEDLKSVYINLIKGRNKIRSYKYYCIYGVDIAPDENLNVKIMEINKGPDLTYKDERDKEVKYNMLKESFEIAGLISKNHFCNNYIKIS